MSLENSNLQIDRTNKIQLFIILEKELLSPDKFFLASNRLRIETEMKILRAVGDIRSWLGS